MDGMSRAAAETGIPPPHSPVAPAGGPRAAALVDPFQRTITYLRVSITDRCNLRCVYCMPAEGMQWKPREAILSYEEIVRVVRVARELGVRKVRVTGGEPLVRHGCVDLIAMLGDLGLDELCLTTNGIRFAEQAAALKAAGLSRVNISLDTLDPDKFRQITRGGNIERVHEAIEAALDLGLKPRINVVAMAGFNEDELAGLADLARERPITVRFIEVMPFAGSLGGEADEGLVAKPVDCESRTVQPLPLEAVRRALGLPEELLLQQTSGGLPVLNTLGPAEYTQPAGYQGRLGFIASMHQHICERCNRVRMTADGWLKPCLLGDEKVDVRTPARHGTDDDIRSAFAALMSIKPLHGTRDSGRPEAMSSIGG
jgi:cyclic pyranopterin phosphate synthase